MYGCGNEKADVLVIMNNVNRIVIINADKDEGIATILPLRLPMIYYEALETMMLYYYRNKDIIFEYPITVQSQVMLLFLEFLFIVLKSNVILIFSRTSWFHFNTIFERDVMDSLKVIVPVLNSSTGVSMVCKPPLRPCVPGAPSIFHICHHCENRECLDTTKRKEGM